MDRGRFKTILLISMLCMNVYLIKQLWFDDSLNHTFFTRTQKQKTVTSGIRNIQQYLVKPREIILHFGDERHHTLYHIASDIDKNIVEDTEINTLESKEYESFYKKGAELFRKVLLEGKYVENHSDTYMEVISKPSIAFKFDFNMTIPIMKLMIPIQDKQSIPEISILQDFNEIIFVPEDKVTNEVNVYFIKEVDGKYEMIKFAVNGKVMDLNKVIMDKKEKVTFISILEQFSDIFKKNSFLPLAESEEMSIPVIQIKEDKRSVEEKSDFIINKAEYFMIPGAVTKIEKKDGTITYLGSKERSLILYPSGRVEYRSQEIEEPNNKKEDQVLIKAISFMEKKLQSNLSETLYLKEVKKIENGYYFSFGQHYQGYPVYIVNEKNEIQNAIEIWIQNDIVKQYNQELFYLEPLEFKGLNKDFIRATDEVLDKLEDTEHQLVELRLAYIYLLSSPQKRNHLQWTFFIKEKDRRKTMAISTEN